MKNAETVAVLGASDNPERYSFKALAMLKSHGHRPLPVHPKLENVQGVKCFSSLREIHLARIGVDTLTMYVGKAISTPLAEDILKLRPKRVIFNPGSENPELAQALEAHGISVEEACTLVLLSTGQF